MVPESQLQTSWSNSEIILSKVTKGGSTHLVNGEKICRNAFLAAVGISRRRCQVLKDYLCGSIKALCMPTSRTITTKTADADSWMTKYFRIECHTTVSYTYLITAASIIVSDIKHRLHFDKFWTPTSKASAFGIYVAMTCIGAKW